MKKNHLLTTALLASMSLAATPALSVTQGTLGATSQGEIDVLLNLAKTIQISSLSDIDFTTVQPNADAVASSSFCVYSNTVAGTYKITTSSNQGTGTGFAMKHATEADTLPYTLTLEGDDGKKPLASGTQSTDSFTANGSDFDCNSSTNATIEASVLAADLESSPAGNYSDTLTLLVTPD